MASLDVIVLAVPTASREAYKKLAEIVVGVSNIFKRRAMRALWMATLIALSAGMAHGQTANTIYHANLPNVPGKAMTTLIVEYPPGASSSPHRHAKSGFLFAYVLSGSIRSRVDGGPIEVFSAGRLWTEGPGAHHTVSENASDTEPARLLVVFVADPADTLTVYEK